MAELIKDISADDLVICLVSGGGSALLTWTKEECDQGIKLYNSYLKTGDDILGLEHGANIFPKLRVVGYPKCFTRLRSSA